MRYINQRQFDGGLANVASVGIGKETLNMFRYGQNIRTRSGEVVPRPGLVDYCDFSAVLSIMGQNIGAMYEYNREYFSGGSTDILHYIVFAVGNNLYYVAPDDSTTVAVALSPALVSGDFYAVNCFDHLFIGNGREAVMVFDGQNTLRQAGITPPAAAPTAVLAGGALTGRKNYKYTYFRDADPYNIESEDSAVLEVTFAAQRATITFVASTDPQVTHYKLYATELWVPPAVAETDYYLVDTVPAATLTYVDNLATPTVTAYDTADRSVMGQYKYLLWHDNRIFAAGEEANPSVVGYTAAGKPFYMPADNWDEISRDDGDVITGLGAIGRTRYIFKNRSIWEWTGDPESITPITPVERPDASQNMVRVGVGCADPRSIVPWVNSLIFRSMDGHVYLLTVANLIRLSQYVETDIKALGSATKAAILDDYYIISDGATTMVCDLRRKQNGWEGFDVGIDPSGLLVDHNGYLLGSEGDKIIRYYTGTQDNGVDSTKIFQGAYANLVYRQSAMRTGIFRELLANCRVLDSDFIVHTYDGTEALKDSGTYTQTDRLYSIPRGARGNFMSGWFRWTGGNVLTGVSLGYLLGRRH